MHSAKNDRLDAGRSFCDYCMYQQQGIAHEQQQQLPQTAVPLFECRFRTAHVVPVGTPSQCRCVCCLWEWAASLRVRMYIQNILNLYLYLDGGICMRRGLCWDFRSVLYISRSEHRMWWKADVQKNLSQKCLKSVPDACTLHPPSHQICPSPVQNLQAA